MSALGSSELPAPRSVGDQALDLVVVVHGTTDQICDYYLHHAAIPDSVHVVIVRTAEPTLLLPFFSSPASSAPSPAPLVDCVGKATLVQATTGANELQWGTALRLALDAVHSTPIFYVWVGETFLEDFTGVFFAVSGDGDAVHKLALSKEVVDSSVGDTAIRAIHCIDPHTSKQVSAVWATPAGVWAMHV